MPGRSPASPLATAPRRAPLVHRLVGAAFAAALWLFRVLPDAVAYGIADLLVPVLVLSTWAGRKRMSRKHRGFFYNVRVVFRGELSPARQRRLLWRWARHMTHLGVDICKMPQVRRDNLSDTCETADLQVFHDEARRGKGLIGAASHNGVYQYTSMITALGGFAVVTIYRASPIPTVTDALNRIREACGQRMVPREGAVREILRALATGQVAGIVSDVSSKESEVFAPFLGTLAATNSSAGMLHLKTGAPVIVTSTHRVARRRYRFCVWDVIHHEPTGDRSADLLAIATRINDGLSRAVYAWPEQWFWDSRRFRTRPPGEATGPDDLPPQVEGGQLAKMRPW